MPTANEVLRDDILYTSILLLQYREGLVRRVLADYAQHLEPELMLILQNYLNTLERTPNVIQRRAVVREMMAEMSKASSQSRRLITNALKREQVRMGRIVVDDQIRSFSGFLPDRFTESLFVSNSAINRMYNQSTFEGMRTYDWIRDTDRATLTSIARTVERGLVNGQTGPQIVRAVRGTRQVNFRNSVFATSHHNITSVVRTVVNHTANQSRQLVYNQMTDVLSGVKWVSTLDGRTSMICRSLDGRIFPVDSGLRPPAHFQCRSVIVPVTRSFRELGIDSGEIDFTTRASINGQVPNNITYNELFNRFSPERVQRARISAENFLIDRSLSLDEVERILLLP